MKKLNGSSKFFLGCILLIVVGIAISAIGNSLGHSYKKSAQNYTQYHSPSPTPSNSEENLNSNITKTPEKNTTSLDETDSYPKASYKQIQSGKFKQRYVNIIGYLDDFEYYENECTFDLWIKKKKTYIKNTGWDVNCEESNLPDFKNAKSGYKVRLCCYVDANNYFQGDIIGGEILERKDNRKKFTTKTPKPKKRTPSKKDKIKAVIKNRINDKFTHTSIDNITINPDYGTKTKNDYVALVYLTWDEMNTPSLSKEMLAMFSEDLAAIVGEKCKNVQEIAVFWTVPYLNDASAKCSYERKNGGMREMDIVFDSNFD